MFSLSRFTTDVTAGLAPSPFSLEVGSPKPLGNVLVRFKRHYFTALGHPNTVERHLDLRPVRKIDFLNSSTQRAGDHSAHFWQKWVATMIMPRCDGRSFAMNGFPVTPDSKWTQLIKRTLVLFGSAKASIGADRYRRCTPSGVTARYPAAKIADAIISSVSIIADSGHPNAAQSILKWMTRRASRSSRACPYRPEFRAILTDCCAVSGT